MRYSQTALERQVIMLMKQGIAPSQIDKRLGLEKGEAHDTVCRLWRIGAWR